MIFSPEFKERWGVLNRIAFRFIFVYCSLYMLTMFSSFLLEVPIRWFAQNIIHWGEEFKLEQTGSGDTTFQYILIAFNLVMTVIIVAVWSILDRKRPSYNVLFYWFQVIVRIFLFFFMLTYGFVKVFKTQFPDPSLIRLLQPLGEMSPMGLAWTYMGFSLGYNIFVGFAEILGGLLVLFRKTVTLGSLVIVGVMGHVAVMNFTYDIPVKLFSVHLVLLAFVLFLTDIKRFFQVFFQNKTAEKVVLYAPSEDKVYPKIITGLKIFVLLAVVALFSFQGCNVLNSREKLHMQAPFFGIWEAKIMVKNGDTIAPLLTNNSRWRYLIMDRKNRASVKFMDDHFTHYELKLQKEPQVLSLYTEDDQPVLPNFKYQLFGESMLQLDGILQKDTLQLFFSKKNRKDFLLINRGYHWVNEHPYNR